MTYQSIRNRIASVAPSLSESQLDWAAPLAVSAATGLGASAFNVVSPWDIDPVSAALASGGATYLMGRGRSAKPLEGITAAPPKKPPTNPPSPTPSPRVANNEPPEYTYVQGQPYIPSWQRPAYEAKVANDSSAPTRSVSYDDAMPRTALPSDVVPNNPAIGSPVIEIPQIDYLSQNLSKASRLDAARVQSLTNPQSTSYSPKFIEQLSQEGLSDNYLNSLSFPEDLIGDAKTPIYNPHNLAIHRDEFMTNPHKLGAEMLVVQPSKLGKGKSYLVDSGYVPDGAKHPNVMTSSLDSLRRMASPEYRVTPDDKGFFIYDRGNYLPTELGYDYNHAQQILNSYGGR